MEFVLKFNLAGLGVIVFFKAVQNIKSVIDSNDALNLA